MSQNSISSLSRKRVFISTLLFLCIPIGARILNIFASQLDLCYTAMFNCIAFLLVFYDWNLFTIHYNRSKYNISTTIFYYFIGIGLFVVLKLLNDYFLQGTLVIPEDNTLIRFGYARFGTYMAYTFCQGFVISILYKCLTDRFDITGKELQVMVVASLLIGLLYLVCFIPFSIEAWIRTTIYNFLLFMIISYLYNQSHSLIPGILAFSTIYFFILFI